MTAETQREFNRESGLRQTIASMERRIAERRAAAGSQHVDVTRSCQESYQENVQLTLVSMERRIAEKKRAA
jgi:hypothetical protein